MQAQLHPYQQQQQVLLNQLRTRQLQELCSFFQGIENMQNNENKLIYRIPLILSISKTPLYVRIEFPPLFPQQVPFIQVLARVTHPDLHPQTKFYQGRLQKEWGIQSTILNLMRQLQADFNQNPPLPENMLQQQQPIQNQQQNPQAQLNNGLLQQQQQQVLLPNQNIKMNGQVNDKISDQDAVKLQRLKSINKVEDKLKEMTHPPQKDQIMKVLQNLNYDELQEMDENEQYLKDFLYEREEFIKYDQEVDSIADNADHIAKDNLKKYDELQKSMEEHHKIVSDYNIKKDKLISLQRKIEDSKSQNHPRELVKQIESESNKLQKDSEVIRKQYKEGNLNIKDFVDKYIQSRVIYYESEFIKQQLSLMAHNYQ